MTTTRTSSFNLIDLAGSERQKSTKVDGEQLKEASNINRSLSALANVITSLVDIAKGKDRHVHYRDSKLTFLLKNSLGGNSKTCIIACVSPSEGALGESLSTLKFAQRAKEIKNKAVINEDTYGNVAQLQQEVRRLKAALQKGGSSSGPLASFVGSSSLSLVGGVGDAAAAEAVAKEEEEHEATRELLVLALKREELAQSQKQDAVEQATRCETLVEGLEGDVAGLRMMVRLRDAQSKNSPPPGFSHALATLEQEAKALQEKLENRVDPDTVKWRIRFESARRQLDTLLVGTEGSHTEHEGAVYGIGGGIGGGGASFMGSPAPSMRSAINLTASSASKNLGYDSPGGMSVTHSRLHMLNHTAVSMSAVQSPDLSCIQHHREEDGGGHMDDEEDEVKEGGEAKGGVEGEFTDTNPTDAADVVVDVHGAAGTATGAAGSVMGGMGSPAGTSRLQAPRVRNPQPAQRPRSNSRSEATSTDAATLSGPSAVLTARSAFGSPVALLVASSHARAASSERELAQEKEIVAGLRQQIESLAGQVRRLGEENRSGKGGLRIVTEGEGMSPMMGGMGGGPSSRRSSFGRRRLSGGLSPPPTPSQRRTYEGVELEKFKIKEGFDEKIGALEAELEAAKAATAGIQGTMDQTTAEAKGRERELNMQLTNLEMEKAEEGETVAMFRRQNQSLRDENQGLREEARGAQGERQKAEKTATEAAKALAMTEARVALGEEAEMSAREKSLKDVIHGLEDRVESMGNDVRKSMANVQDLEAENEECEDKIEALELQLKQSSTAAAAAKTEAATLLIAAETRAEAAGARLLTTEKSLADTAAQLAEAVETSKAEAARADAGESDFGAAKDALEEAEATAVVAAEEHRVSREALQSEMSDARGEIARLQSKEEETQEELFKMENLQEDLDTLTIEYDTMEANFEEELQKVVDLEAAVVAAAEASQSAAEAATRAHGAGLAAAEKERDSFRAAVEERDERIVAIEAEAADKHGELAQNAHTMRDNLAAKAAELDRAAASLEEATAQLANKDAALDEARAGRADSERAAAEALETLRGEKEAEGAAMRASLAEQGEALEAAQSSGVEYRVKAEEMEGEMTGLRGELDGTRREAEETHAALADLEKELEEERAARTEEGASHETQIGEWKDVASDLREKLRSSQDDLGTFTNDTKREAAERTVAEEAAVIARAVAAAEEKALWEATAAEATAAQETAHAEALAEQEKLFDELAEAEGKTADEALQAALQEKETAHEFVVAEGKARTEEVLADMAKLQAKYSEHKASLRSMHRLVVNTGTTNEGAATSAAGGMMMGSPKASGGVAVNPPMTPRGGSCPETVETAVAALADRVTVAEEQSRDLQEKNETLQEQLDTANAEVTASEGARDWQAQEYAQLKTEHAAQAGELAEANVASQELESSRNDARDRMVSLREDMSMLEAQRDTHRVAREEAAEASRGEKAQLEGEIAAATARAQDAELLLQTTAVELVAACAARDEALAAVGDVEGQLQEAVVERDEKAAAVSGHDCIVAGLEAQIAAGKEALEKSLGARGLMVARLEQLQAALDQGHAAGIETRAALEKAQGKVGRAVRKAGEAEKENTKLKEEVSKLVGHSNNKQKIKHTMKLKTDLNEAHQKLHAAHTMLWHHGIDKDTGKISGVNKFTAKALKASNKENGSEDDDSSLPPPVLPAMIACGGEEKEGSEAEATATKLRDMHETMVDLARTMGVVATEEDDEDEEDAAVVGDEENAGARSLNRLKDTLTSGGKDAPSGVSGEGRVTRSRASMGRPARGGASLLQEAEMEAEKMAGGKKQKKAVTKKKKETDYFREIAKVREGAGRGREGGRVAV